MTILLDTNVLSELLRGQPASAVLGWFAGREARELAVSSVTQAEMLYGARLLRAGRRRHQLQAALDAMFDTDFQGRILAFDAGAARQYADIVVTRRAAGRPMAQFDAQIAAIARQHGAALATRNTADFAGCGLTLHDPWQGAAPA